MKQLPIPETYEEEFSYFPWKDTVAEVIKEVVEKTPKNASVIDLMCGPGHILGEIRKLRPDLNLAGLDIDKRYIDFAKQKHKAIKFICKDVLVWKPQKHYDLILCTAGIHHLPYDKQEELIKLSNEILSKNGKVIIADPLISDFKNEKERKLAAAELGYKYIAETIKNKAPDNVIKASLDILYNDVLGFEYKNSLKKITPLVEKYFIKEKIIRVWPKEKVEYGDHYMILRSKEENRKNA